MAVIVSVFGRGMFFLEFYREARPNKIYENKQLLSSNQISEELHILLYKISNTNVRHITLISILRIFFQYVWTKKRIKTRMFTENLAYMALRKFSQRATAVHFGALISNQLTTNVNTNTQRLISTAGHLGKCPGIKH